MAKRRRVASEGACELEHECRKEGASCDGCERAAPTELPKYEATGKYVSGMSPMARCLIQFPDRPTWEPSYTVLRCTWEGVAISMGQAQFLGLKPGTKVKVTLEVVE